MGFFVLLLVSMGSGSAWARVEPRLAFWSEFVPFAKVATRLPLFRDRGYQLYLAITEKDLADEDLYRTWKTATDLGVHIRAWLLLTDEEGYWANKWNAEAMEKLVWKFLAKMDARGLRVDWITLDFEPPQSFYKKLQADLKVFNLAAAWKTLQNSARDEVFERAYTSYYKLVLKLRARNTKVHAVTVPFVLHDLENKSFGFQNSMGVPITGIPWDELSFMVYRPEFEKILGSLSSYTIYAYAKRIRKYVPNSGAIDLGEAGEIHEPFEILGYTDPERLREDYGAAMAAGVGRMNVYSLDGLIDRPDFENWVDIPAPTRPKTDYKAKFYFALLDVVSKLLGYL